LEQIVITKRIITISLQQNLNYIENLSIVKLNDSNSCFFCIIFGSMLSK